MRRALAALLMVVAAPLTARGATYEVGPGKTLASIGEVPWESLVAGDVVNIYWRSTPYKEKWVIGVNGTAANPITIHGVPDPATGALPVIDGDGATTRTQLDYTNEVRAVIKIGTANVPNSTSPTYIVVENLDVKSARPPYTFTRTTGASATYATNAAAIWVETGDNITIRNCIIRDSGNGFFSSSLSSNILVDGCFFTENGISGSILEHSNYTESNGITFQFNHMGPLRAGCLGNNLKDRSSGLIVRYNWIESGNRQLDLVDSDTLYTQANYAATYVYGNVLIEPDGAGNSQIVHFGGDSGTTAEYRTNLFFYGNTVVSTRTGNTTLFRLSAPGQTCDARNNVFFAQAGGSFLAMMENDGTLNLRNNWLNTGFVSTHNGSLAGTVNDLGGNVTGSAPGFTNLAGQDFTLATGSQCIDVGTVLASGAPAVTLSYLKHQQSQTRTVAGAVVDMGAYEAGQAPGNGNPPGGGGGGSTPAIAVTPASFDYGTAAVGSAVDAAFTVRNSGAGTLVGSVTTTGPFTVVSGGTYSLGASQTQAVIIRFAPTATGTTTGGATFTGGAGATVALTGAGGTVTGGGNNGGGGRRGGGGCAVLTGGAEPLAVAPLLAVFLFLVALGRRRI